MAGRRATASAPLAAMQAIRARLLEAMKPTARH